MIVDLTIYFSGRAKWTNRYRDINTPLATQAPYGQSNARNSNSNYTNGSGYGGGGYGNNFNNYSNGAANYSNGGTFGNGQNYQTKGYEHKNGAYQSGNGSIPRNMPKFQNPQYQTQYNGGAGQKYGQSQVCF